MARIPRIMITGEPTAYHIMSCPEPPWTGTRWMMWIRTEKLGSLSEYVRKIKVRFTRFYNKRHGRRGYFWGDRFKSVIVENGQTLINCLAYIDLNPVRWIWGRPSNNKILPFLTHKLIILGASRKSQGLFD